MVDGINVIKISSLNKVKQPFSLLPNSLAN